MLYNYKAKTTAGEIISGVINANSSDSAKLDLRRQGHEALSVAPKPKAKATPTKGKSVPKVELLMLTTQLAIMCDTGVDLAEAIEDAARQATHPVLRKSLIELHKDINDGKSIAVSMERQKGVFGSSYVASFAAGESSGNMSDVLNRLAAVLDGEIRLASMMKAALAYPVVLTGLSMCTLGVLLFFVLPQFGKIFSDMKVPLPGSTEFLLAVSHSVTDQPGMWGLGILAMIGGVVFFRRSPGCQRWQDHMLLNAKVVCDVTRSIIVGRAFRLCGTMVQSGVPLLDAIRLTRTSVNNLVFRDLFNVLETEVLNGRGIGAAILATKYIPRGAARMVVTAEKTGRLGLVMEKVGLFYEADGERRLQEFSKLLEPVIIIGMGVVVAVVVLSILLPMFALTQMAGID